MRLESRLMAVNVMLDSIGWQYSITNSWREFVTVRSSLAIPFLQSVLSQQHQSCASTGAIRPNS